MTYCFSRELGSCSCLRLRVRWCSSCQQWVCRMLVDLHACERGTPLFGMERLIRKQQESNL